nr:uncharacterized mitochondrial protein AtMg00810-like [Tanacetum cinerariifolium]
KRIFRYLKGQPKLGLWYPRDSPFGLMAYTNSDYAGASLDRKSTLGGCQFLGCRLISWQCKKQNVVATSTTEAEYVAAASCCGQVLWIQNQLLDYGRSTTNMVEFDIRQEDDKVRALKWFSVISKPLSVIYIISIALVKLSHYHKRPKPITLIELYSSHQSPMTNLEFYDKHNMVDFLKKPQGSKDFNQIMDFLNASHIRPLDNEEIELNAIVDSQDKTITEACVRRHLKLADADGEGPTRLFGTQHAPTVIETSPQLQNISNTYRKTRTRTRRMGIRISESNVPSSVVDESITKEMHDGLGKATTTASSLEVEQGSEDEEASLDKEDSSKQEMMIEEINEDENVNLVKSSKKEEAHKIAGHRIESDDTEVVDFNTASPQKDDDEITLAKTLVNIKKITAKDKGKAIMQESEPSKKIKKKEMIQISLDEEIAQSSKEGESLKRPVEEELGHEQQKKQKVKEDLSKERLQQMMVIIPEQGIRVEALFSSSNPTEDKEISLWVDLKRLFKPDEDYELWKFESFKLIWRLYDWCRVHHISTRDGHNIFMLVEKEYPLSRGALVMMLVQKLQVDEHNEMAEELLRRIFMQAERPRK